VVVDDGQASNLDAVRDDDELYVPHLLLLLCVLETSAVMRHWSWRSLDGG
jgi:hypothetical protein